MANPIPWATRDTTRSKRDPSPGTIHAIPVPQQIKLAPIAESSCRLASWFSKLVACSFSAKAELIAK